MSPRARTVALALGGGITLALAASACQPGEEPKTPVNAPLPTKLDRPDEPTAKPTLPVDAG